MRPRGVIPKKTQQQVRVTTLVIPALMSLSVAPVKKTVRLVPLMSLVVVPTRKLTLQKRRIRRRRPRVRHLKRLLDASHKKTPPPSAYKIVSVAPALEQFQPNFDRFDTPISDYQPRVVTSLCQHLSQHRILWSPVASATQSTI